jgi:hypothetical protein
MGKKRKNTIELHQDTPASCPTLENKRNKPLLLSLPPGEGIRRIGPPQPYGPQQVDNMSSTAPKKACNSFT